jgi:hypothetical protein
LATFSSVSFPVDFFTGGTFQFDACHLIVIWILISSKQLFAEAGQITGQTFTISDIMKQEIEAAGFVNVVERVYKTPIGGWPADPKLRELGQWALLGFDTGLEGFALATLTRVLGVSGA